MNKDKKTLQEEYIKFEKLDLDQRLYRYSNHWHVMKTGVDSGSITPNENATEMIEDMYQSGHTIMASDIGPGLSFLKSKANDFKDSERRCVSISLKAFIDQGGYIYPDKSTYEEGAYFLMLPKGVFKVKIED